MLPYSRIGSFVSCFFHILGQEKRFRLKKPRVLLALEHTFLICEFHFKSLAIVTPRYLMLSTFSRTVEYPLAYIKHQSSDVSLFLLQFTISLLHNASFHTSRYFLWLYRIQPGLCQTWSETPRIDFLAAQLKLFLYHGIVLI